MTHSEEVIAFDFPLLRMLKPSTAFGFERSKRVLHTLPMKERRHSKGVWQVFWCIGELRIMRKIIELEQQGAKSFWRKIL